MDETIGSKHSRSPTAWRRYAQSTIGTHDWDRKANGTPSSFGARCPENTFQSIPTSPRTADHFNFLCTNTLLRSTATTKTYHCVHCLTKPSCA